MDNECFVEMEILLVILGVIIVAIGWVYIQERIRAAREWKIIRERIEAARRRGLHSKAQTERSEQ